MQSDLDTPGDYQVTRYRTKGRTRVRVNGRLKVGDFSMTYLLNYYHVLSVIYIYILSLSFDVLIGDITMSYPLSLYRDFLWFLNPGFVP